MEVKASEADGQLTLAKRHKKEVGQQLKDIELKLQFLQKELDELIHQLYKTEIQKEEPTVWAAQ